MEEKRGYLAGQLLIAMPSMTDPRFERTVIYLCVHNEDGAMGLVVNRLLDTLTFKELMEQLRLPAPLPAGRDPGPFRRACGIRTWICAAFQ